MKKQISIRLTRSLIGKPNKQRKIVQALGLRKINHEVIREDIPSVRGMIHRILHMVEVNEVKKDRKK